MHVPILILWTQIGASHRKERQVRCMDINTLIFLLIFSVIFSNKKH